jgi:hypothetical protein
MPAVSLRWIADADWFDRGRARVYRGLLLALTVVIALGWVLMARDGIDAAGKPLGTDFLAFWSASRLALSGNPAGAYDIAQIYSVERATVAADPGLSTFLYPPPFLLACLPLALVGYWPSLALWLAGTGAAYVAIARRWLEGLPGKALTVIAFPAVLVNAGHGQNGFLTAALLGGGLLLNERRPWLAGALLGALIVKPQIALAVPILVLATGRWRVMAAGIASAATLCVASWLIFGADAWTGFIAGQPIGQAILERGLVEPGKMVSVFAALRVVGAGSGLASAAQAAAACAAAGLLVLICRRHPRAAGAQAAACIAATPLISPFFLDYDLTTLVFPLAWLLGEGVRRGFRQYEKAVLGLAYLLPLIARPLALQLGIPVAPLLLFALLCLVARAATVAAGRGGDLHDPAEFGALHVAGRRAVGGMA